MLRNVYTYTECKYYIFYNLWETLYLCESYIKCNYMKYTERRSRWEGRSSVSLRYWQSRSVLQAALVHVTKVFASSNLAKVCTGTREYIYTPVIGGHYILAKNMSPRRFGGLIGLYIKNIFETAETDKSQR